MRLGKSDGLCDWVGADDTVALGFVLPLGTSVGRALPARLGSTEGI